MFSPETIRDMSREAGVKAKRDGDRPFAYWRGDPVTEPFPFPQLGDFRPEGWELVDELFIDATGWGYDDEPALSVTQLKRRLTEIRQPYEAEGLVVGFGIIEVGQFQAYLGVFENTTLGTAELRKAARAKAELGPRESY